MTTPIITNLTPKSGPTLNGTTVRILGLNFALSVEVYFAGVKSTKVVRVNDSLLYVDTPTPAVDPITGGEDSAVDVKIVNLDTSGIAIPGEEHTLVAAYAYELPRLTETSAVTQVVHDLILDLRRFVIAETVYNQHTDYSDITSPDGLDLSQLPDDAKVTRLAKVPALLITGPSLVDDRIYNLLHGVTYTDTDGNWLRVKQPVSVDLEFELTGVANTSITLLNLMSALINYIDSTTLFTTKCADQDAEYNMFWQLGGYPDASDNMNTSDIVTFSARIVIKGVLLATGDTLSRSVIERGSQMVGPVEIGDVDRTTPSGKTCEDV